MLLEPIVCGISQRLAAGSGCRWQAAALPDPLLAACLTRRSPISAASVLELSAAMPMNWPQL